MEELNVVVRMGKLHPKTITNKSSFLKEIRDKTYVPVPVSYSMSEAKRVNKPVFVKFNTTVIDDNLVPKGKDIYNNKELENYLKYLTEKGFDLKNVEIQELLSTDCKDNISICGWYEKGFHSFHQTRKVLQHPPKRGAGDVIEYMDLNENLADYAMQILVLFDYCGPFEIEFIKEKEEEKYKVLEMNPRFWMQHALVEQISGHLLVARYIGISPVKPVLKYKYWMYPVISLLKIAVGNFNYMPFFFKKDVIKPISVGQAIRFLLLYLLQL
ncbi:MAG: hypothetical protein JXB49_13065 [Bacteroidales bacterium]|nr:hypothetical protein [Bacteroidales bacterium]